MHLRIDPASVRKVMDPQTCFAYHGAVLIADQNGIETSYAIKTAIGKLDAKEFFVKQDGRWVPSLDKKTNAQLASKFKEFIELSGQRYERTDIEYRSQLKLVDGLTVNRHKDAILSVMKFDGIYNGQFIRVEYDQYFTRPFDLSSDWMPFAPTASDKKIIANFTRGVEHYMSKKTTAIKYQTMRKASVVF